MSLISLESKRDNLKILTKNIIDLIFERSRLSVELQNEKKKLNLATYDLEREKKIYDSELLKLEQLSLRELLSLSLLIEEHAGNLYPQWSNRVHLMHSQGEIFEMINPIILKKTHPTIFNSLQFVEKFSFFRDL